MPMLKQLPPRLRREAMIARLNRFLKSDKGATAVEYGLMVALIAVVVVSALTTVGTKMKSVFTSLSGSI